MAVFNSKTFNIEDYVRGLKMDDTKAWDLTPEPTQTFQFTKQEIKLILDALAMNEKHSTEMFGRNLTAITDIVKLKEKTERFLKYKEAMLALQLKLCADGY